MSFTITKMTKQEPTNHEYLEFIIELASKIESGKRIVKSKGYWIFKYSLLMINCIKHKKNNDRITQAIFL